MTRRSPLPYPHALAVLPAAISLVLCGFALTAISIGGTGDTPCGSLIDPSFGNDLFDDERLCGMMHTGTLAIVVTLVVGGGSLAIAAALAARGRAVPGWSARVAVATAVVMATGWAVLAWRTSDWDEFHTRGWSPVRDLAGYASIGLVFAVGFVLLVAGTDDRSR